MTRRCKKHPKEVNFGEMAVRRRCKKRKGRNGPIAGKHFHKEKRRFHAEAPFPFAHILILGGKDRLDHDSAWAFSLP